jgi:hypothetical protein
MKFKKPESLQEAEALLEKIKALDGAMFSDMDILDLGYIMLNVTEDFRGLRSIIALRYSEANNRLCIPFLIEAIKRNIHTQYVSSLIHACSQYDCSEHLQLFVDLLILKDNMCFVDAYYVIENMKSLNDKLDKVYAVNKLKAFLEIVGDDFDLKDEVLEAIDLLSAD